VQFAAGVREFNVGHPFHHPHPPGFPLYMLAAKIVRPFVESDFIACQTIVFLSACALFPLAFFVARELRFPFATSYSAALLFVFLPNVWFFGGTAFSDIPGVAASLAAAMLLLRGCRSPRAYLGGAIVLGVAAGIRPQALLLGCAPFLAASWFQLRQSWLRVIGACAIVAAIVSASYIGAALASNSIAAYRVELLVVRNWVRGVDSFLSPQRPPLRELADDYFVRAVTGGRRLPYIISALAAFGLLAGFFRSRISVWLAVATFIPFTLFAYLMLDYNSVHRYSTAYVFLWALLAAHGTGVLFAPLRGLGAFAQVIFVALLAARAVQWTIPALREVRTTAAPPYAAMQWIRTNVSPRRPVWVHGSLEPFAEYFLEHRDAHLVYDLTTLPRVGIGARDFYVAEGLLPAAEAVFLRPRDRVWEIARHRYFETSIVRLSNVWGFGEGWYGEESDGRAIWQWMGARSETLLPAIRGPARLTMTLAAAGGITPEIEVQLNGAVIDRFRCGQDPVRRQWTAGSRADAPNRLVIVSSGTVKVAPDPRDLSVQLISYSWQPVR